MVHAAIAQPGFPVPMPINVDSRGVNSGVLLAGTSIFMEGETVDRFYELVSGVVRLSKMLPDGRRQVLGFLFAGEVFTPAGFAFHSDGQANCTADAVTPVEFITHRMSTVAGMLASRPELTHELLATAGRNLLRVQQQMLLLGRMSAVERLAWFLAGMARQLNQGSGDLLHLPMSRLDIADYLGLTVETVSRVFGQLRDRHVIAVEGPSNIRVLDHATLAQMAEGSYAAPAAGRELTAGRAMRALDHRLDHGARVH